jgi:hypothetical protein
MGGVRGPVADEIGVGTQRQAIEAAAPWEFRVVALQVQRWVVALEVQVAPGVADATCGSSAEFQ